MKKELYVHIPTPCHEDWQQMTPVDKGRFCESCAKQVVDFSLMTDQEILNHLSKASGKLCGRFANDQLQRPLQPLKEEKKKFWWIAAMMPLLMLFEKAGAQKNNVTQGAPAITIKTPRTEIMGKMRVKDISVVDQSDLKQRSITGKITDKDGKSIPFANIMIGETHIGAKADTAGAFQLMIPEQSDSTFINISAIGYTNKKVYLDKNVSDYIINLEESVNTLNPVTVISDGMCKLTGTLGGIMYCTRIIVTKRDTVRKVFNLQPFKVYPNPAASGSAINIDIKNEGVYSIQLFDNNGKLLQVNEFEATKSATQTSVTIPSSLAAGMYYIRLVDDKTKKQYTDKIVVL